MYILSVYHHPGRACWCSSHCIAHHHHHHHIIIIIIIILRTFIFDVSSSTEGIRGKERRELMREGTMADELPCNTAGVPCFLFRCSPLQYTALMASTPCRCWQRTPYAISHDLKGWRALATIDGGSASQGHGFLTARFDPPKAYYSTSLTSHHIFLTHGDPAAVPK